MIHPTAYKARLWHMPKNGSPKLMRERYINAPTDPQRTAEAAFAEVGGPRYRVDYVRVTYQELGMVELPGCLA